MRLKQTLSLLAIALGILTLRVPAMAGDEGFNASSGSLMATPHFGSTEAYHTPIPDLPEVLSPANPSETEEEGSDDENGLDISPGTPLTIDPATLAGPEGSPTTLTHSFTSMGVNGWNPADPTMAAGPSDIMVATNDDFYIYDRDGNQLYNVDINTFTGSNLKIFDPKLTYDRLDGRFLMLWMVIDEQATLAASSTYWLLMISDNSTAIGNWSWYFLDAGVNGATANSEWADYPYLGYNNVSVSVTARMFGWFGSGADYGKIRFLRKSQIYAGLGANWWDFWGQSSGGNPDRNIASCPQRSTASSSTNPTQFFVDFPSGSTNQLTLWRFQNTDFLSGGPTLTRDILTVGSYSGDGAADQPDTAQNIEIVSPRVMNAVWQFGRLWTVHSVANGTDSVLKSYRLNTGTTPATIEWDGTFGASGFDYYYPSVDVNWLYDDAMTVFARSGASEYASIRYTGRQFSDAAWGGSLALRSGVGAYSVLSSGRCRWGDYFGAAQDPWDLRSIWMYGMYASAVNTWDTWVGRANWKDVPTVAVDAKVVQTSDSVNLTATLSNGGSGLSGYTLNFFVSGVSVGSATTDGSGVATIAYSPGLVLPTSRTISVTFDETTVYNASSGSNTLTISKANTACFTSALNWQYSEAGYLWGYLWRSHDGLALTGRIMTYRIGGTIVGTAAMGSSWTQLPLTMNYTPAAYTYTTEYAGDSFYNSSVSSAAALTIGKADTTVVLSPASGTAGQTVTFSANLKRNTDNANLNGQSITFKVAGVSIGSSFTNASGNATFNYVIPNGALGATATSAEYAGNTFYNASSGASTVTRIGRTVSGTVNLQNWTISSAGITAQFELVSGSGTTVATWNSVLNASGAWSYSNLNVPVGTYALRCKAWHWLSKVTAVNVTLPGATGIAHSLKNGDVDQDNEVAPNDFSILSAKFGLTLGDPGYSAAADLDGDTEIGPSDFSILASNFGETGE